MPNLNLATIYKNNELVTETEMRTLKAGEGTPDPPIECNCESFFVYSDIAETSTIRDTCHCGSIWVVIGLTL